jgi:SAM-dependent methyltransferase
LSPRASFDPAWRAVADAANVSAGTSLLDLGCGSGAFCSFAAARGAVVHGLDVEPEAISQALTVLPDADLRLGLMEHLPWPDGSFDVVTSFNSLQYALDIALAVAEACRVVRSAGCVAICKWGRPAQNEFFGFLISLGAQGVRCDDLPLTDPIEDLIGATGLDVRAAGEVAAPIEMSGEGALRAALAGAGIDADPTAPLGEADVATAAAPYRQPDGGYRFDNRLRYWIVRPPEAR